MKLIIDIPEKIVTAIQNGEDYRYDIHTAIAQGIPYEPKGDLISREYMKEAIEQFFVREKYYHPYSKGRKTIPTEEVLDIIDNAPTVEVIPNEEGYEMYGKGYLQGYERGKHERPQGEWIEIPVKRDLLYNTGIKYTCSICGSGNCYGKPPFCMYCGAEMQKGGADMRGEKNDT